MGTSFLDEDRGRRMRDPGITNAGRRQRKGGGITLVLCLLWLIVLFLPGGVGTESAKNVSTGMLRAYTQHVQWDALRHGSSHQGALPELVVFIDFGCAACARTEAVIDSFAQQNPAQSVGYRYAFPALTSASRSAAQIAVCAASLSALPEIRDSLYAFAKVNPSERRTRLHAFAEAVLPSHTASELMACTAADDPVVAARLAEDSLLTSRLQLRSTPTFVTKYGRFEGIPTLQDLNQLVERSLTRTSR